MRMEKFNTGAKKKITEFLRFSQRRVGGAERVLGAHQGKQ